MAAECYLREPTDEDVYRLAVDMRSVDRNEVEAGFGSDVNLIDMLFDGVSTSYQPGACVGNDGKLWCLFGVVPIGTQLTNTGLLWLLATTEFDRHPKSFTIQAKNYIEWVRATRFPVLTNFVDARNRKTIRWLQHLGFTMDITVPYGVSGLPFHRFHIGVDQQCVLPVSH